MEDPEIDAMRSVSAALTDLDEQAKGRVLRWASEKYGVTTVTVPSTTGTPNSITDAVSIPTTEEEIVAAAPTYEHFAELFAAANPKTDADKALVAAYWVQVIRGTDKWPSRLLNNELKNLGHSVGNITKALSNNMDRKPQRIIQLQKTGSSRQGNKIYKATHEGVAYVQGMIGKGP
jgi:hypothetical protein